MTWIIIIENVTNLLEEKGLLDRENEVLVGIRLWIGENHGGKPKSPYIHCLIYEASTYKNVSEAIESEQGPLDLKSVSIDLTNEEFLGLFKRFSVVLTKRGLGLDGREYNEYDPI